MVTWIALRNVSTLTRVNEAATFAVSGRSGSLDGLTRVDGQDGLEGWTVSSC